MALLAGAAGCAESPSEEPDAPASRPIAVLAGDVGEVLAAAATAEQMSFGPEPPADARLAYVNVDRLVQPSASDAAAQRSALDVAKAQRLPILFESHAWDVPRLHAVLSEVFPGTRLDGLEHVAVLAEWDDATAAWRLTDTTPTAMIAYLGTTELAAAKATAGHGPTEEVSAVTAAAIGTVQAHWLLPFAEAAYDEPATVSANGAPPAFAGSYSLGWAKDVVKIYRRTNSGVVNCVVTWRGTTSIFTSAGFFEWVGNLTSQLFVRPFYLSSQREDRVGAFWNTRLQNQRADVNRATKELGCGAVHVTGHSLGGAMAQLHAHYYAHGFQDSGIALSKLQTVAAWNPARVGNGAFKDEYRGEILASGRTSKVFCRDGDPVRAVPLGLQHTGSSTNGCDVNGGRRSALAFWKNHELASWYQCQSTTSC